MGKYCCFLNPSTDYTEKSLDSTCPICGRPYGFPLINWPETIGEYRVLEARGRGFYASTYLCERGRLNTKYILKVSPAAVYDFFKKSFEEECRLHREVCQDTEHIVSIEDYFDETIRFGEVSIPCHVAVVDFVAGESLAHYFENSREMSAESAAQIAIDLVRIWRELTNKNAHHNDLHAENIIIQQLRPDAHRAEALDETIRAVAIDLGSVADHSKSDIEQLRLGDQHWLCRHIQKLAESLIHTKGDINAIGELENRISEALEKIAYFLIPSANASRVPSTDQMIRIVRDEFARVRSPWQDEPKLERFDDSYNALALEPWFVPFLLVDPDSQWVQRIAKSGPMLIIGMRGCGKTMLLRALEFHARAAKFKGEYLNKAKEDRFVGFFVSCTRLLTTPGSTVVHYPFERLFCSYCLEAIRAIRHLKELDRSAVHTIYYEILTEAISINLDAQISPTDITSDNELERRLLTLRAALSKGEDHALKTSPADAFTSLAEAIRNCSTLWNSSRVLFLLDDVSTRFLHEPVIKHLFSSLLFQNPICAFKLSTEAQTMELTLHSPGLIEKARVGRDYEVFDLGAEVYEKTRERRRKGAKLFIEEVLEQRAQYYPRRPAGTPSQILGDCTLEEIARKIASSAASSRERKAAYRGISALSAVCVGDIGDVIIMYELLLRRAAGKSYPLSEEIQSECYQDFCSRRLYDLNRRESDLKDYALSFAEAAHELLLKSHSEQKGGKSRLRQYSSVYVRVTTGDTRNQFERLRELIDAGVFVLHGGIPRTKTRDSNPIQQFKLTFRKLFGLSNFIGLAERDRFELSGKQLQEWLEHPKQGKDILLRNLGGPQVEGKQNDQEGNEDDDSVKSSDQNSDEDRQKHLFETVPPILQNAFEDGSDIPISYPKVARLRLNTRELKDDELRDLPIEAIVVGLGFEERTLESAKRLLARVKPRKAIFIQYSEPGRGKDILNEVSREVESIEIIDYGSIISGGMSLPNMPILVDITGLAKPALFHSIRSALLGHGKLWIAHTGAEIYYPTHDDISAVLSAAEGRDHYALLESLSSILAGEAGPYSIHSLLSSESDESRRRVLCTFASAKHQRLLTLLDYRDYDRIEIVVPFAGRPRSDVARIAAEVAAWNFRAASISEIRSDDLEGVMKFLSRQYFEWYVDRGYNLELGLTGSKLQAVACAAVSVEFKVSQCWYVRPEQFDDRKFTKGTGLSRYFEISRSISPDKAINAG